MVPVRRKINWDKAAVSGFKAAIKYIRKDSDQNAEKAKKDILFKIGQMATCPELGRPDKNKLNNIDNYRVVELHQSI